ncbi:MAG: MoaD/ThiS family protein [Gammaproteobacteria bacterium]
MRKIQIKYFAVLRDHAGKASEVVESSSRTTADLYNELQQRYQFPETSVMKVAVNDEFRNWDYELGEGDLVVFIPPVAGG